MKKSTIYLLPLLAVLMFAATASAQAWRGVGRVHGTVVDQNGKPIRGAKVILKSLRADETGPDAVVTDSKGRWAAGGLIGGPWHIDVEAEGFYARKLNATVSEIQRLAPPMEIQLEPLPPPEPVKEEAPQETIAVAGVEIDADTAAALEAANAFMRQEKWAEAAAEYEKALAVLGANTSLKFALARAYYGSGELKKAIALLQSVHAADTGNVVAATLLANMLIEDGSLEEAKKVLNALPPGAISDPEVLLNIGILFMNKEQLKDSWSYFDKAVAIASDMPIAYYYRALASLQLRDMAAAKKDLNKFIQMAPDMPEATEAKELLAQIK